MPRSSDKLHGGLFIYHSSELLTMRGCSFTFGGYRKLDHIDGEEYPKAFVLGREGEMKIKDSLPHDIFGIDGVMAIARDYLPGGALLPIDIFPPREINTNEVYQLLYSVACCSICTGDVIRLIRRLPTYTISLIVSRIRILHLLERYRILRMEGEQKELISLCNSMGIDTSTRNLITSSQIYFDVYHSIFTNGHTQLYRNVVRSGVILRTFAQGKYMKDVICNNTSMEVNREFGIIDSVIIFGRRRDMKKLRKVYGAKEYYSEICKMTSRTSYLDFRISFSTLGLEEMIVFSTGTYSRLLEGYEAPIRNIIMGRMFSFPKKILRENCEINEEIDGVGEKSITLTYEGKKYTVGIQGDPAFRRVVYRCGNGVTYSYYMLLLIIVHRFIFTYDRDFLVRFIRGKIKVDQQTLLYFSTPTTRPAIHDLICPPDVFFGDEVLGSNDPLGV